MFRFFIINPTTISFLDVYYKGAVFQPALSYIPVDVLTNKNVLSFF
jgi:hypothetical protein